MKRELTGEEGRNRKKKIRLSLVLALIGSMDSETMKIEECARGRAQEECRKSHSFCKTQIKLWRRQSLSLDDLLCRELKKLSLCWENTSYEI